MNKGKLKNPIAKKLRALIGKPTPSGGKITKEYIAVITGLTFYTISNIMHRRKISYNSMFCLKRSGIINEEDEKEYRQWLAKYGRPGVN